MNTTIKTMVLTGASRGIGHATVKRFSEEGWRMITCSREAVPDACKRDPNWSAHIPTDLSDPKSVAAFIEEAMQVLGSDPLHALINNAAISPKTSFKERLGCLNGGIERWREALWPVSVSGVRPAARMIGTLSRVAFIRPLMQFAVPTVTWHITTAGLPAVR